MHPLEKLTHGLQSFVAGNEQSVLLLTTTDVEVPLVVRVLENLDERSPADVMLVETTPMAGAAAYAGAIVLRVIRDLDEVNAGRSKKALAPLALLPPACTSSSLAPAERLRALFRHMLTWLPPEGDHRLVVALLPETIANQKAQSELLAHLVPVNGVEPWMRRLRLLVRDDGAAPFAEDSLRRAGARNVLVHRTDLTVGAVADATARDAEDPSLPLARRLDALLQCAALDVALGRYEAAIDKYGRLYKHYEEHHLTEMQALAAQGTADVLARLDRLPAARGRYLQALDLAADARSLQLIMSISAAIGDVDMKTRAFVEAARSYELGAGAAEKLANGYVRADLLDRCGTAHEAAGDVRAAVGSWTAAATVARVVRHDACLLGVLEHLRRVARKAGHGDKIPAFDAEITELRAQGRG